MGTERRFKKLVATAGAGLALVGCAPQTTGDNTPPTAPNTVSIRFDSFSRQANVRHFIEQLARHANSCTVTDVKMIPQEHDLSILELTTKEAECVPGDVPEIPQQTIPKVATIYEVGQNILVVKPAESIDLASAVKNSKTQIEQTSGTIEKSVTVGFTKDTPFATVIFIR